MYLLRALLDCIKISPDEIDGQKFPYYYFFRFENILLSILERNIIPKQFYLPIGAGIWEELHFRKGVIGSIMLLMMEIIIKQDRIKVPP